MFTLAINEVGDIYFENGNLVLVKDEDVLVQQFKIIFGTRLGEYFLNSNEGINHEALFGNKTINEDSIRFEIMKTAEQVEGFIGFKTLDFKFDSLNRKLNISLIANFKNGLEVNFEDEVII